MFFNLSSRLCVKFFLLLTPILVFTLLISSILPARTYIHISDIDRDADLFLHDLVSGMRRAWRPDPFGSSDRAPVWSPDGSHVAYASFNGDNYDVYVSHWSGASPRDLTFAAPMNDTYPAWSPDNTRVAFIRSYQGVFLICLVNAAAPAPDPLCFPAIQAPPRPFWSPDSTCIAFLQTVSGRDHEIYIASFDPLTIEPLFVSAPNQREFLPQWSPDGSSVFYLRDDDDGGIFRYDLHEQTNTPVYRINDVQSYALAPDGSYIALTDGDNLTIITADGAPVFDRDNLYPFDLAWSADSAILAFTQSTNSWDVAFLDLASGVVTRDVQPGNAQSPAWRP